MNNQYIELKKKRELGDILSDTFAFLRNQFKPFFSTFFKIVGPYLLVTLISFVFFYPSYGNLLGLNGLVGIGAFDGDSGVSFILATVVFVFASLATYVLSQATTLYYMQSYAENNGEINFEDIKRNVYKRFWSFIGLGFLVGISLVAGIMLCCLPGIYLYVPLSLSFAIMVFTSRGATDAFGYSFDLVKDHWWITFATMFVVLIIVSVASYAFSLPAAVYQLVSMGISAGEGDAESIGGVFTDPIYLGLQMISTLAQYLLNIISLIAIALIYFNLNEIKNNEGTMERISKLGKTPEKDTTLDRIKKLGGNPDE